MVEVKGGTYKIPVAKTPESAIFLPVGIWSLKIIGRGKRKIVRSAAMFIPPWTRPGVARWLQLLRTAKSHGFPLCGMQ